MARWAPRPASCIRTWHFPSRTDHANDCLLPAGIVILPSGDARAACTHLGVALRLPGRVDDVEQFANLRLSSDPHAGLLDHLPGDLPFLKSPAYGASKAAVVNMTKYFSTLWGKQGVRVNALSPGGVLGGQDDQFKSKYGARVPLGRMAQAEDLKGPLVFLASAASSYVTGHELRVDGGFTAW